MHLKSVQETAIDPAITVKKENKIKLNAINRQGLKSGSFVGFITILQCSLFLVTHKSPFN